jgi:cbb3-type cytochrome oxidase subunit 3
MGRTEEREKAYPLWVERFFLLVAGVVVILYSPKINAAIDHAWMGPVVAYIAVPLALLAAVELMGRFVQGRQSS